MQLSESLDSTLVFILLINDVRFWVPSCLEVFAECGRVADIPLCRDSLGWAGALLQTIRVRFSARKGPALASGSASQVSWPQGPGGLPTPWRFPPYRALSVSQVIFRFALALFKYKEEEILRLQDSMSIFKYLRYFSRTILDAR